MLEAPVLDRAQEALVAVAAGLATRDTAILRSALERTLGAAAPRAVDEVILQSHLFVGFPDTLSALQLWRETGSGGPAPAAEEDCRLWEPRGAQVCALVYGSSYTRLRANVAALHPDLDRWMVEGGYGRVIGREGLDLVTRELCIVALLAVWNAPRQLHSHLHGALNVGAGAGQVERAVGIACQLLDPPAADRVRTLWDRVRG
jgi:4-carboxymuconolactone decarboxylase